MLRELAVIFPEVRQAFEEFDQALAAAARPPVGPLVFPPASFSDAEREDARRPLWKPTSLSRPWAQLAWPCFAFSAAWAASRLGRRT